MNLLTVETNSSSRKTSSIIARRSSRKQFLNSKRDSFNSATALANSSAAFWKSVIRIWREMVPSPLSGGVIAKPDLTYMPKLIVKPTVNFLYIDTDPELMSDVATIIFSLTDNDDYKNPEPALEIVSENLSAFRNAYGDSEMGGALSIAIKNKCRADLVSVVGQLAKWVATACEGDLSVLMSSGFPIHKPTRHAIGMLDKPVTPRVKHGNNSGTITARTKPVRGVFIYNWQLALASDPDTILQTVQSTGANATFRGLTPGQVYCISVNAVGAAGPTDFSGPAPLVSL